MSLNSNRSLSRLQTIGLLVYDRLCYFLLQLACFILLLHHVTDFLLTKLLVIYIMKVAWSMSIHSMYWLNYHLLRTFAQRGQRSPIYNLFFTLYLLTPSLHIFQQVFYFLTSKIKVFYCETFSFLVTDLVTGLLGSILLMSEPNIWFLVRDNGCIPSFFLF